MSLSELNLHLINTRTPKISAKKFSGFYCVEIDFDMLPTIKLFFYSQQELVNFKNSFLWTLENLEVINNE